MNANPPTHRPPRIRVSALVIDSEDRVLLVRQGRNDRPRWMLPGGGVEGGEAMTDALVRELAEETGLTDVRVLAPVAMVESIAPPGTGLRRHVVHVVFAVRADEQQMTQVRSSDRAIREVRWMARSELMGIPLHPPIAGFLAEWRQGAAFGWLGRLWAP